MSRISQTTLARRLLAEIRSVDRATPPRDRAAAERALDRFLTAAGFVPFPVRWMPDLESAIVAIPRTGTWGGLALVESDTPDPVRKPPLWTCVTQVPSRWLPFPFPRSLGRAAWPAEDEAVYRTSLARAVRRGADDPWYIERDEPRGAALGAAWAAVSGEATRTAWLALLDAFRAGLWIYWVLADEVVAVPLPRMQTRNGVLHAEDGPAVAWEDGARYWFWRGVQVPQDVIERPGELSPDRIRHEENAEVRRVMIERFGIGRFLKDAGARLLDADSFGALYRLETPGREPLVVVRVTNATPEPDGTRREYFLQVPPTMSTARAAVAWTFGMTPEEYFPEYET
jgi:hypothetical protein